jgi:hypothetical protein
MRQQLRQYANRQFKISKKAKDVSLMFKKILDLGKKTDQSARPVME